MYTHAVRLHVVRPATPRPRLGQRHRQPARQRLSVGAGSQPEDRQARRALEDELRDPKNFLEYFLPRPLRLTLFGFSAASCLLASLLSAAKLAQMTSGSAAAGGSAAALQDLGINVAALLVFGGLYAWDQRAAEARVQQRARIRKAQIAFGDREVFISEQGEKMSRLKEFDDEWTLRRLERWGRKDGMPFIGPKKGAILQALVEQLQPRVAVEVGTLAGYSALLIAQRLPPGGRLVSYEKDLQWSLVAKRFMSQASQGRDASRRPGNKVEVVWGEACGQLAKWASRRPAGGQQIELLLLDGTPKETLDYLKAAEPHLAPGAVVVADNAVVFAQGGMAPYLQYVRGSPQYSTALVASTLEWRDDVEDGMEVSVYQGRTSGGKTAADLVASVAALPSSPSSAAGIETAATTVAGPPNAAAASVGAAKPST